MSRDYWLLCDTCKKRIWLCSHRKGSIDNSDLDAVHDFIIEHAAEGIRIANDDEDPRSVVVGLWHGNEWNNGSGA